MLKCLACGHENAADDVFCANCVSSLNLRLCSACDAMNAKSAHSCHDCGATLPPEDKAAPALADEPKPIELQAPEKSLPAQVAQERGPAPEHNGLRFSAVVASIAASAAVLGFYFSDRPSSIAAEPTLIALAPAGEPSAAQTYIDIPPTPEPAPVAPVVDTKEPPVLDTKELPVVDTKESENRAIAPVTHTRVAEPVSTGAAAEPLKEKPSKESIAPGYRRVTHTKGSEPAAQQAASPAARRADSRNQQTAECAPAVAALGLCRSR